MALTEEKRIELWEDLMADISNRHERISINKHDLKVAIDVIAVACVTAGMALIDAIPEPAGSSLTGPQKRRLIKCVISKYLEDN